MPSRAPLVIECEKGEVARSPRGSIHLFHGMVEVMGFESKGRP